jgi:alkylation response protein AidB-like acyl-CoA dehydrogenase
VFIPDVVSEEHAELRATVRRLVETQSPESAVRAVVDSDPGYDIALWRQMAEQLGLHGLGLPEAYGGSGFGPLETTIVFEELGRALVPSPFLPTVGLAATLLVAIGDEQANRQYLPRIASGELIATVAVAEQGGSWHTQDLSEVVAGHSDRGWRLTGEKTMVLNADTAKLILVVVRAADGTSVYAVEPDAPGVTIVGLSTLDLTRRQAKLCFNDAPATFVGGLGEAAAAVASMLDRGCVALAAEQAGAAGQLMELSVQYAKLRHQFGRPIGAFQAIKHKLADMAFDVERMDSIVRHAASTAAENAADLPVVAAMAKVFCSEAFFRVAAETIQVHGGIGFTWEHPAHLYFRRAKSSEYLLGSPARHRESLLQALGA